MAETTATVPPAPVLTEDPREPIYRRNFICFIGDFVLFSVALSMVGATTVIPDFVRGLTDSEVLIALSSQMFEVGWLLPQLLVARQLVGVANKKWWFVGPNIPVRFVILIFAGLIVLLGKERPGAILVAFLVCYGIAAIGDGLVGVPWVDLIGSSLDSVRRARFFGMGQAMVGLGVLGMTPLIAYVLSDAGPDFPNNYALLFGIAGTVFVITIPIMMMLHELPGGEARATPPTMREYLPELVNVLRHDRPYRAMITVRVLASLFTLANPFYIGFATEQLGLSSDVAVSRLLLVQTMGNVGGSLVFWRLGDRYGMRFIRLVLLVGMTQPALALVAAAVGPAPLYLAFLAAGVLQGTLGISFLNWLIAYTTPDQRPVYSGLFNSVLAVSLFVAPLTGGTIVEKLGYEAVFVAALVIISLSFYLAVRYIQAPQHTSSA